MSVYKKDLLDYDDVEIALQECWLDTNQSSSDEFETAFLLGDENFKLPVMVCYDSKANQRSTNEEIEEYCRSIGVATVSSSPLSTIQYTDACSSECKFQLAEHYDVMDREFVEKLQLCRSKGKFTIVGSSLTAEHGKSLVSKSAADAILVGPVSFKITWRLSTAGLRGSRVSTVRELTDSTSDVPVIATVTNSAEACKAFVAGADAVMIKMVDIDGNFTNLKTTLTSVRYVVNQVTDSLKTLCKLAQAKNYRQLKYRCKLVAAQTKT